MLPCGGTPSAFVCPVGFRQIVRPIAVLLDVNRHYVVSTSRCSRETFEIWHLPGRYDLPCTCGRRRGS